MYLYNRFRRILLALLVFVRHAETHTQIVENRYFYILYEKYFTFDRYLSVTSGHSYVCYHVCCERFSARNSDHCFTFVA